MDETCRCDNHPMRGSDHCHFCGCEAFEERRPCAGGDDEFCNRECPNYINLLLNELQALAERHIPPRKVYKPREPFGYGSYL